MSTPIERDVAIGQNVRDIRGERSQAYVADAMRKRGWKWAQNTVWAVEAGERPLRLAEAVDIADVLGFAISALLDDSGHLRARLEYQAALNALHVAQVRVTELSKAVSA